MIYVTCVLDRLLTSDYFCVMLKVKCDEKI